jgi:hypothetical protein
MVDPFKLETIFLILVDAKTKPADQMIAFDDRRLFPFVFQCRAYFRHQLSHMGIMLFLVIQTAHEAAAQPGDFCRIQGKILVFCHFNGHRCEIRHPAVATDLSATTSQAA